jgi:hypothetical protein
MDWHEAYLAQARSEFAILRRLSAPDVEYCHRLHYLQMVTEKLAKAMLTPPGSETPAPASHVMFVKMLQVLKGRREIRRQLRYPKAEVFTSYINSLLDLAGRIERLSPDQAGFTRPNPEYPWWKDRSTRQAWAPMEYDFPEFNPRDPRMSRIDQLIGDLLRLAI